jgi:hypothetical protein
MRSIALAGLGIGFILMGGGLFALTLRKPKPVPPNPNSKQLREQAALADEQKKMRIGAGVVAGFGIILLVISANG